MERSILEAFRHFKTIGKMGFAQKHTVQIVENYGLALSHPTILKHQNLLSLGGEGYCYANLGIPNAMT